MHKICLNMIVKNESEIIEKALASLVNAIDYYVICDTGSTDNTPEIIRAFFEKASIPGEIHNISFVDFEQARNTALQLAQQSSADFDYILLTDADMEFRVIDSDFKHKLGMAAYLVRQEDRFTSYYNVRLIKKDTPACYKGVTHEYLYLDDHRELINMFSFFDYANGGNRPEKYERDVRLLKEGLSKEPDNSRYMFYLAQTYFDMGDFEKAKSCYQARISMNDWEEEVYYSYYRLGLIEKILDISEKNIVKAFLDCYAYRPFRAEPLYELAHYYRCKEQWVKGYLFAKAASDIPLPSHDILFVGKDIYDYKVMDELAVCAYWVKNYQQSLELCQSLLKDSLVPEWEKERISKNLNYAEHALQTA